MSTKNKDKLVNLVKWGLICCGLWRRPVTKNPFLSKLAYAYALFARFDFICFYLGLVAELVRLMIFHQYTLSTIITSFSVAITSSKIAIIALIYLKNNVLDLLDEITRKEEEVWTEHDEEIVKLFNKKIEMGKIFMVSLWTATFLTVTTLNITGIFGNNNLIKYNEANNASVESHFLYQFWFPANRLDHLVTVTTISWVMGYGAIVYNVTTNLLVVMLCIHAATHLSLLQHRLRIYIPEDFKEEHMEKTVLALTDILFRHRYIIAFTTHVNKTCKNIIMMEFVLTSIDVASVALNIINKMNLSDMGWLIFYFPMLIIQIYSLAWSANEVNIQSQAVADAAYESRWYLLNRKGKQMTQILIQRAQQRPLIMTIGAFGPMTLQTFLMIMKGAYTYVSVMRK